MSRDDSRDQIVSEQMKDQYDEERSFDISNDGRDFVRRILVTSRKVRRRLQNSQEETSEERFWGLLQRATVLSVHILIWLGKQHGMDSNIYPCRIHNQRRDVSRFLIPTPITERHSGICPVKLPMRITKQRWTASN
jgi:hypothetical protein